MFFVFQIIRFDPFGRCTEFIDVSRLTRAGEGTCVLFYFFSISVAYQMEIPSISKFIRPPFFNLSLLLLNLTPAFRLNLPHILFEPSRIGCFPSSLIDLLILGI